MVGEEEGEARCPNGWGERGRRANRGEGKEREVSLTGRLWCDGEGGDLFQSAVHHFGSSCGGVTYLLLSIILFMFYIYHTVIERYCETKGGSRSEKHFILLCV